MTNTLLIALATGCLLLSGCADDAGAEGNEPTQLVTLESSPPPMRAVRKPPQIEFDSGPVNAPVDDPATPRDESAVREMSPDDEKGETSRYVQNLPFTPKIAMDPVDGSKISIRRDTPIAEYKGRVYYFGSEANRREFIRGPDQFLSGPFAAY